MHEQGRKCHDKGWIIIWSYHFILFPLHTWPALTRMDNFCVRCFRRHVEDYLFFRGRGDLAGMLVVLWPQLNKLGFTYILWSYGSISGYIGIGIVLLCQVLMNIQYIVKYRMCKKPTCFVHKNQLFSCICIMLLQFSFYCYLWTSYSTFIERRITCDWIWYH